MEAVEEEVMVVEDFREEPKPTPIKAKRRVQPILVSSIPATIRQVETSLDNREIPFTMVGDSLDGKDDLPNRKKQPRPNADNHSGPTKRSKGFRGQAQYQASQLEPFLFFITSPPINYACAYGDLCKWLEGCVNGVIDPQNSKFSLNERQTGILLQSNPSKDHWLKLLRVVNNSDLLEANWSKFTLVDRILNLFGEDEWNERNLPFITFQPHVWWVAQVRQWFSLTKCTTCEEYIQTATSALVLELFYRLIWARFTGKIFQQNAGPLQAPSSQKNGTHHKTNDNNNINSESTSSDFDDDVLDQSELGEGSESESASEVDDSIDDSADEAEILSRNELKGTLLEIHANKRLNGSFQTLIDKQDENNESIMECDDDDENGDDVSSDNEESSSSDESTKNTRRIPTLVGEEVVDSSIDSKKDGQWDVPSVTPLFFAHPSISSCLESIEIKYWNSMVTHGASSSKATENQTLSEFFSNPSGGFWDTRPAFNALVDLVYDRNYDFQLSKIPKPRIQTQVEYIYANVFVPFLKKMGIEFVDPSYIDSDSMDQSTSRNGNTNIVSQIWKFNSSFGDYYFDNILKYTFYNLTEGGMVPARNFLALFPSLFLLADAKTESQILHVSQDMYNMLSSKGKITPEIETLIRTLDSLTSERSTLLRQDRSQIKQKKPKISTMGTSSSNMDTDSEEEEDDDEAPSKKWIPTGLESRLHSHRLEPINQIDHMIQEVRNELNKLTGDIDKIQSKRKRRTKTQIRMDLLNLTAVVENAKEESNELPTEEELWGMAPI